MADVENLARQSQMVFRGTIVRLNAATMPEVPVTPSTAVVRVDETLQAPDVLGDQAGQEITVQLREGDQAKEGDVAIFFVNPWLYGDSLAVQETGRSAAPRSARAFRDQLNAAMNAQDDDSLQQRLAEADAVVSGIVHNAGPIRGSGSVPISEHDPDWWEASIAVDSVLKGNVGTSIKVLFPHSMDVIWYATPKLVIGQEGIFLLHTQHVAQISAPALTMVAALDVHPKTEIERIRRLIEASQQQPER